MKLLKWLFALPLRLLLKLYLWLWDENAQKEPNNYTHRKIIYELRKAIKTLQT